VSRVTLGLVTLSQRRLDLRDVVVEAAEQTRPLIEACHHNLRIALPQQPLWVDGDHTRLVQAAANLLNNAAKYTSEGGEIRISLEAADDLALLRVRDNGIGIATDLLPDVFELFAQGQRSLDRSQGGLGLGLALVKKLVELHGGSVAAASGGSGLGSEFTVRLPLRDAAPQAAPRTRTRVEAVPTDAPLRILVVDDNTDAADTLALLLQTDGYRVSVEYTAGGALRLASEQGFDVLLLDIGLPDMDGYELARRLRQLPHTANAVLVAISGYGQEQDMAKSRAAGFSEHMVKPIDNARLAGLLARLAEPAGDAAPSAS
jgi:CheY-like chemotaxis protein/two-component sensor histidine kinase